MMQAGFLCLETGKIRSKNSINVAAKNLSDFIIAAIVYWMFGFGLMFGDSIWGIFGTSEHFFGATQTPWQISFFFFQMMFCGTAATLMSGAVAERMSFHGYLIITTILCSVIYPVVGHWVWAGAYHQGNTGWLESIGFIDFAGSTVVHSVGGWIALAATIIIGPRLGRFDKSRRLPVGNNLPMAVLGTLLIWLGWFGFNGGSTLALNESVPAVLLNTCLAAAWGGLAASGLFVVRHRYVEVTYILNGVIAGLVSITASAHMVSPLSAALIGFVGGIILYIGNWLMDKWQVDDVLSVVPAHLFAGIWGTLAVALFARTESLPENATHWSQLQVQLLGVVIIGLFSFGISFAFISFINRLTPLRVSNKNEMLGMNISEHRASTELIDLLSSMKTQEDKRDFAAKVPVEPFTEVGQIARQYNRVINRVKEEMHQRDQAIENFRSSEKRKSAILDSSMDSIITIDLKGFVLEFNPAAERTFGQHKNQVVGSSFINTFVLEKDRPDVQHSLEHKFATSSGLLINRRNSISLKRGGGDIFPAEITITSANVGRESMDEFTLHVRDVTRQHKLQNKLRQQAYSDPLTGLYNRAYLIEQLNRALTANETSGDITAIFFLDLDRFKKINDTLGHKAGDELLLEVAARLSRVVRQNDVIARWGGDEFVVMMRGTLTVQATEHTAEKILQVMREPVALGGRELKIPTSIGIALAYDSHISAETLIQHADIAMYFAKKAGRDTYKVFVDEMANTASHQFHSEQALRQSLNTNDAFHVVYQPKVNNEQTIIGLEALARWQHPDGHWIPPTEFIPLAEEANLIIEIEEHIIELVCRQLCEWDALGIATPPVAINLSGKHLHSPHLLPFVKKILQQYSLPGELLEFEVTEGVFLTEMELCIEVLTELQKLGICIAIDDFGTGYSSLSYLKRLPVNVLKIDRSFVDECATSEEDAKICATIISLAQNLELKTVAEGVETAAQFDFLSEQGCDEFQGYYFFKPLSNTDIQSYLPTLPKASKGRD